MWLIAQREPHPDQPYWPGRCGLAVLDAVGWPLMWVLLISKATVPVGVIGPFVSAVAILCAVRRLHRAVWVNHRYRFTTWRVARIVGTMLFVGFVMKLLMAV